MASKYPMFGLRVPPKLMKKLKYIASFNGRSANKEIEQLIRHHVLEFENKYGAISDSD